jgi:hypothetical protein
MCRKLRDGGDMEYPPPIRHPAFARELALLGRSDTGEARAVEHAIVILQTSGPRLGFPHTSAVRTPGRVSLRELRPRRGRSRHRVLFAPRGGGTVLLALAPEATHDRRGFRRAIGDAHDRLAEFDEEHDEHLCH